MADGCGKGFYRDKETGRCKRSIEVSRKGVYGKGFLSESQGAQYRKIDEVARTEPPEEMHEQLAAMNAFESHDPAYAEAAKNDLRYSEEKYPSPGRSSRGQGKDPPGGDKRMAGECGPDEIFVEAYTKTDGTKVAGYCKHRPRITAQDRRIDSANGEKAHGSTWRKDRRK